MLTTFVVSTRFCANQLLVCQYITYMKIGGLRLRSVYP